MEERFRDTVVVGFAAGIGMIGAFVLAIGTISTLEQLWKNLSK